MTIGLPSAIAPWAPWLAWFSDELREQLAPLVQRLHPLLSGARQRAFERDGEPDGFDGLRRRGAYERLIGTEWLLADELPDEFLRRAAAGEHLFFAPKPRGQRTTRLIIALFDAGPSQLGSPRLAQLALWILLARRAQQCGGQFRWGLMHAPGTLHDALAPADLRALLDGRSYQSADAAQALEWQGSLRDENLAPQECWAIGAMARLSQPASGATHRIGIARGLRGEALDVALADGGARRAVQLPLPEGALATQLLKGLFIAPEPVQSNLQIGHRVSLSQAPLIAPSGARVGLALLDGQGILLVPTAKAMGRKVSKPKEMRWGTGERPLMVTPSGKSFLALHGHHDWLQVWHGPHFGTLPRPPADSFDAPNGATGWLQSVSMMQGAAQRLLVIDRSCRLVCWKASPARSIPGPYELLDTGVLGMFPRNEHSIVYVARGAQGLVAHWSDGERHTVPTGRLLLPDVQADKVFFSGAALWRNGPGACALRTADAPHECWLLNTPRTRDVGWNTRAQPAGELFMSSAIELAPGQSAIGIANRGTACGDFCLVGLDRDRQRLLAFIGGRAILLYTAPSAVVSVTMCAVSSVVAMLTCGGQLIVYDVATETVRMVAKLEDGSAP